MTEQTMVVDGNEAVASVAYRTNEVIAIYPITPASPMGEHCDAWARGGRVNHWQVVPEVIEMQSEGGAAGTVHGSLQAGALTTTFTSSQGLLLMIPNMFKIAGELTPTVFHVAARTVATHALSIFGDHSDVMSVRSAGWAMLASNSVQEAHDFALIAQRATLRSRVPILHFFDGFRTSHEIARIDAIDDAVIAAMLPEDAVIAHRQRGLNPDSPVLRGTAQNPDVFFQAREAINPYYEAVPEILQEAMQRFQEHTGRSYQLYEYVGAPDAERIVVVMASASETVTETVTRLVNEGEKVGVLKVVLYRPFATAEFVRQIPTTVKSIAVLDRTKEPGAIGEPLYQDVVTALHEQWSAERLPKVIGGRYGLASKEFTPAMARAIFAELKTPSHQHFTVGIVDDVSNTSLQVDPESDTENPDVYRALFWGLGSDGTVGAVKSSAKMIASNSDRFTQGYFVYDSKKSGSVTISHLRVSSKPIAAPYLIQRAQFLGCHQFQFLDRLEIVDLAETGATLLINTSHSADQVWQHLPAEVQQGILDKDLQVHVVNAAAIAADAGLGHRINTVMQTCFFALTDLLPQDQVIDQLQQSIRKVYGRLGNTILERNFRAVEQAVAGMQRVALPQVVSDRARPPLFTAPVPDFVERVTGLIMAGHGDRLPVSALPVDGTFPLSTARYEKRSIAREIPIWDPEICIQCALCSWVCPHAAIRTKVAPESALGDAPDSFRTVPWKVKNAHDTSNGNPQLTIQVAPDDCTGCGVCVDVCPAKSKEVVRHRAINMEAKDPHLEAERANFAYFLDLAEVDRTTVNNETIQGTQLLEPLFEFSGACAGCGETPYLKLITQLMGDRMIVANATGCSSIYGGNLPTTPWSQNAEGRGPAWSNSLFEDNAEFGLGMRLAVNQLRSLAEQRLAKHAQTLGDELVQATLDADLNSEEAIQAQRQRLQDLTERLQELAPQDAEEMRAILNSLGPRSVWIVGGDGWAYDIGFGGLDHVLASGHNVNVLVLDTEVYSNTGGQASKSTPRAAIAKFAAGGKAIGKKDLGMIAMAYGNVYVAHIAMGANPKQALQAIREAESYPGPSLVIAYSQCIAHGLDMTRGMQHQKDAVRSGYWPLYRYDPRITGEAANPFALDSRKPSISFRQFADTEARFAMLARANPNQAEKLFALAQADVDSRFRWYQQMVGVERSDPDLTRESNHAT